MIELRCINCGATDVAAEWFGDGFRCSHVFEAVMSPEPECTGIIKECPVCKRVIWANSTCHHGGVVRSQPSITRSKDAPKEIGKSVVVGKHYPEKR